MKRSNFHVGLLCLAASSCGGDDQSPAAAEGKVIGATSVEIDTRTVTTHTGEAAIGNFIADAYSAYLKSSAIPVDIAFINGGFIRGGPLNEGFEFASDEGRLGRIYPAGNLTDVDVKGWTPFPNRPALTTLTGAQLKSVLERSAAALPPDLRNDQGGWLLHGSGLKVSIDCSGARQQLNTEKTAVDKEGERITKIEVGGTVVYDKAAGVDTLADGTFRVAGSDFVMNGGDGHLAFSAGTEPASLPEDVTFTKIIVDQVTAQSPITPAKDGRMTIVGGCDKPATLP